MIGFQAPADLVEPQPLKLPVKTEQEAAALAAANNPNVIMALFNNAAAKDAIDAGLRPAHAAGQPAGPGVPAEQHRRPLRDSPTATW